MALFADDAEQLREIASEMPQKGTDLMPVSSQDRAFLLGLADRIVDELAEPEQFPWPGPEDTPEEP